MRSFVRAFRKSENGNSTNDMMPIIWICCFMPMFIILISSSSESDIEDSLESVHKAEAAAFKVDDSYLPASDLASGRKLTTEDDDIRVYVLNADKNNFCAVGFEEDSDDVIKKLDDVDNDIYAVDKSGKVKDDVDKSCAKKLQRTDLSKLGFFSSKGYVSTT